MMYGESSVFPKQVHGEEVPLENDGLGMKGSLAGAGGRLGQYEELHDGKWGILGFN